MAVADELLDRLASAPFADWVRERDAIAKELRGEGRREEADEVKALRKPPAPVWAVNQLALRRPRAVERLVRSAERLRTAQAQKREDFATARAEERDALEAAVAESRSILAEAGSESEPMVGRLEATLRSAAATEATAELLRRGRLAEELEASGFDALLGAFGPGAPTAPPPSKRPSKKSREREVEEARKRVEEARRAATAARKAARDAERRADAARRDAERAEEEAKRASADADDADAELEAAKAALSELRKA